MCRKAFDAKLNFEKNCCRHICAIQPANTIKIVNNNNSNNKKKLINEIKQNKIDFMHLFHVEDKIFQYFLFFFTILPFHLIDHVFDVYNYNPCLLHKHLNSVLSKRKQNEHLQECVQCS